MYHPIFIIHITYLRVINEKLVVVAYTERLSSSSMKTVIQGISVIAADVVKRGTGADSSTLLNERLFDWVSGIDSIGIFRQDSGFTSCFFTGCGSPVPKKLEIAHSYGFHLDD